MQKNFSFGITDAFDELKDQDRKQKEIIDCFKSVFNNSEGQKVLSYLKGITLEKPTWNPDYSDGDPVHQAFAREGQNSVIRFIEKLIK